MNDKHAKGRDRQGRRAAKREVENTGDAWEPPADRTTVKFEVFLDATNRMIVRKDTAADGSLVDYAVIHETNYGAGWEQVTCIDCCHGAVHRHDYNDHSTSEIILTIREQQDVQSSFDSSYDEVHDSYLAFKERT